MKKFNIFKIVMAVVLCMMTVQPALASASARIDLPESIKAGESFNITVAYEGDDFSRVDAQLEYDTEYIKYISGGTSSGNSGVVQISDYGDENGAIKVTLKFEAKKDGQSKVLLNTSELYNYGEEYIQVEQVEKNITVDQKIDEEAEEKTENIESVDEETDNEDSIETENVDEHIDEKVDNHDTVPFDTIIVLGVIITALLFALLIAVLKRRR